MDRAELERLLRAWGHAQATRYCYSRSDRVVHVLDKARDLAPGTKENALRELVRRDGKGRRRFMGSKLVTSTGEPLLPQGVPSWAVDPIRAKNDADSPHDNPEIAVDQGIPDELRWIESAIGVIHRESPVRAMCLQIEYTEPGTQRHKAVIATKRYGGKLSLWQYRREVQRGLDTIHGIALSRAAA